MKVLIIGAGAIGVAIGASLLSEGVEVDFIARENTRNALKTKGLKRSGLFGTIELTPDKFRVFAVYDEPQTAYDYIIIAAKTYANEDIAKNLGNHQNLLGNDGKIVIMQNGWGNDLPYLEHLPKEQIYSARVITGFRRIEPYHSEITVHTAPILLGSLYGCDLTPIEPLAQAINHSGIPTETSREIQEALLAKLLYNSTLNPLGAILKVNYGRLGENEYSKSLMNAIMDEFFAVIHAAGYKTFWSSGDEYRKEFYSKLLPDTYEHRSSTLQDIEKKQRTEINTLTGCIIEMGEKNDVPTPVNKVIYNMIKAIEADF